MRERVISALCAAFVLIPALGGCSALPSSQLDSGVMTAASRAESAAADAASALARVQSAASAINRASSSEPSDSGTTNETTDATVHMKTITSEDGKYALSVPDNWQDLKGQLGGENVGFLIETGSYDDQTFFIFGAESSEDSNLSSFDDYFSTLTQGITGSSLLSDVKTSNPETITLKESGLQGKKVTFTAQYHPQGSSDQRIAYRIYGAEGDKTFYQFCCWTTAANSAMMSGTLDAIVNSFTVQG